MVVRLLKVRASLAVKPSPVHQIKHFTKQNKKIRVNRLNPRHPEASSEKVPRQKYCCEATRNPAPEIFRRRLKQDFVDVRRSFLLRKKNPCTSAPP